MGGAFTIYQQLGEEKKGNFDAIKDTLLTAFGLIYSVCAVCGTSLVPRRDEDVFLVDLKSISMLLGGTMKQGLKAVFVPGLPKHVWQLPCASSQIEEMDIF